MIESRIQIDLPNSLFNFRTSFKVCIEIRADIKRLALTSADQIHEYAKLTGFVQLKTELTKVQRALASAHFDTLTSDGHGFGPFKVNWAFGDETPVVPEYYLVKKADDLREKLRHNALLMTREVKRLLEDVQKAIQQRYTIEKCESIINNAQASLNASFRMCIFRVSKSIALEFSQ